MLRILDPFLTLGSGMGKSSGPGSVLNILDHISESLLTIFVVKKTYTLFFQFSVMDQDSGPVAFFS
jgi:hypothetical protein